MMPADKKSFLALLVAAVACSGADLSLPNLDPPPIVEVVVYTFPNYVQIGDTLRISAEGFNSVGYGYVQQVPFIWSSPDSPKMITLESTVARYAFSSDVLVRGQSLGKATVTAVANKVTGTGTVEVIPQIARIVISPASATLAVGDTLRMKAAVITPAGDTLTAYQPLWDTNPQTTNIAFASGGLVRAMNPGTVEVIAKLAGVVGRAQLTVVAH